MNSERALPTGYKLEEYELVRVLDLGSDGFGVTITYLGHNTYLDTPVVIKEYFPDFRILVGDNNDKSDFDLGLKYFLSEAKTLARFRHPNLVQVHRYIEANNTAYIIMEYAEGDTLSEQLRGRQSNYIEQELKDLLYPILDGLKELHQQGIIHRDIKPGNIIIRDIDQSPVLFGYGAAKKAFFNKSKRSSMSTRWFVSSGNIPLEGYQEGGEIGPWTDIYGLGAMAYIVLTGDVPVQSGARATSIDQQLTSAVVKAKGQASESFLQAIDAALSLYPEDRPQSIDVWRKMLDGI